MKAFLMYPDRDFDPNLLISRRERDLRSSNPDPVLDLHRMLPWNEASLTQDLGLDILLSAMAEKDRFLFEAAKVGLLCGVSDPAILRYRQHILRDSLRREAVVREMYQIAVEAVEGERKVFWISLNGYPTGTLHRAIELLEMFVDKLRRLRRLTDRHARGFVSDGFSRLLAMLQTELSDDYFAAVSAHLSRLKFRDGVLVSARLGKGNKGTNYLLRRPHHDPRCWIARLVFRGARRYTYSLHPRDEAGGRALSELRDHGINLVANALAQSADHILSFFQMLRTELAFYLGCLNLHRRLQELGAPTCFPDPAQPGSRDLACSALYDPCLALSMKRKVVSNEFNADGKDLIVITGANTGGKSTFLRSLGLAQLMMQAGMFVAATRFSAEVCTGVLTHFKREEDTIMESGKLDEELSRMDRIVGMLRPNSLMLLNESFASTNERESSEIADQISSALVERGIRIAYVTHLYEFTRRLHARNPKNAIFLRADRQPDGTRTFRLIEGAPLQTSYGEDLYDRVFGREHSRRTEEQPLSVAE